jgi:hypothetical protein
MIGSEQRLGLGRPIEKATRAEIYEQLNSGLREIRQSLTLVGESNGRHYSMTYSERARDCKRMLTQFNGDNFLFDEHDQHRSVIIMTGWMSSWPSDWAYFQFQKMQDNFLWVHFDEKSGDVTKVGVVDIEAMKANGAHNYNHSDKEYRTDYDVPKGPKSKKKNLVDAYKKVEPFLKAFREGIDPRKSN